MTKNSIEERTCKFVAKFAAEKRDVDWLLARYERMRDVFSIRVHCGDGSCASGELIADAVAEVNAAARLLASKGIIRKEIR